MLLLLVRRPDSSNKLLKYFLVNKVGIHSMEIYSCIFLV